MDIGGGVESTVLVSGPARSGSTWIGELINADNRYRVIWEPFRPKVPRCRALPPWPYVRPEDSDCAHKGCIEDVLHGRVRDRHTRMVNQKVLARQRLVKATRATLMLAWLHRQFPSMPIVAIVRHPCAMTLSSIRRGWTRGADYFLPLILAQETLMVDHLAPHRACLDSLDDPFARHFAIHCIEYTVFLRQWRHSAGFTLFYEEFVDGGKDALAELFQFLNLSHMDAAWRRFGTKSSTVRAQGAWDPLRGWVDQLNANQRALCQELLTEFQLQDYFSLSDPFPDVAKLREALQP